MRRSIRAGVCAVALLTPLPAALAFGELDGGVGSPCATFTTCTATPFSHTWASAVYEFNNILGNYQPPGTLIPGYNSEQSEARIESPAALLVAVGECPSIPCGAGAFQSSAETRAQSDFGVNRAFASTSFGAQGHDVQAGGNADVRVTTGATANSVWRDAWTFSTDGHFSATILADGQSSRSTGNPLFPSTFTPFGFASEWSYDIKVWDVNHLTLNPDHLFGPTQVGAASMQSSIAWNQSIPSFASTLSLDFNFVQGVQYVVIAELRVNVMNGREIDLYNTARLTGVALSNGASLNALSGHDYLAPVPEPRVAALLLGGLVVVALRLRLRLRPRLQGGPAA